MMRAVRIGAPVLAPALLLAGLLAGCASTAPAPGSVVDASRIGALVVPGVTTRAALLAALGPTQALDFDNGYAVWRYRTAQGGQRSEVVILLGPDGVVRKLRQRDLDPSEPD